MSGIDLINTINELSINLTNAIKELQENGLKLAENERNYKIKLMQESLKLKSDDMPVTLISKVVYGKVANERMERDIAEVMYKNSLEFINSLKLQLRILDNQLAREWGKNE